MRTKSTSLFLFVFCLNNLLFSQNSIQSHNRFIPVPSKVHTKSIGTSSLGKTATCATDTIEYPYFKTTGFNLIGINASTSAAAAYQWYPAMQSITVKGFNFFAFLSSTAGILSQSVTINIYNSTIDSLPTGTPLRSITMNIDSVTGNGSLLAIRKMAMFTSPITIPSGNGYVLSIENASANNVLVVCNNWNTFDGAAEWCSSLKIGTSNLRSYNVNVGGVTFDADFLMHPIVNYSITSSFTTNPTCFTIGNQVNFTNTSSAINFSRFYNFRKFAGIIESSFNWDFGNSTGGSAVDTSVTYGSSGPFNVKLTDTLEGYYKYCVDVSNTTLNSVPNAPTAGGGGSYCQGSTINLTCVTVPGAAYTWAGPNGFSSTSQNPVRTGASTLMAGTYNVTVTVNGCTSLSSSVTVSIVQQPVATNNSPVCYGESVVLSSNLISGASYSWTGPNGFSSNLQNAIIANLAIVDTGLYTLSVSLAGCSFNPTTTRVTGIALPQSPTVSNTINTCVGSNVNLTAGGTYTSPSYTWSGPNNYFSNSQNPSFAATSTSQSGTYSVRVSSGSCASNPSNIVVNISNVPTAPTVSNNGALCEGQTLVLNASLVSGATYNWTGPNGFTSTLQNPTINNSTSLTAGNYTAFVVVGSCSSAVATTSVSVIPQPIASNNSPVCFGQAVNLSVSSINNATYSWTGPNGFSSTSQNPTRTGILPADTGIYTVTVSTTSCSFNPSTTRVSGKALPPNPTVGNSINVCLGNTINLSASGTYTSPIYSWTGPNGFTSNSQNPSFTGNSINNSGTYNVTATSNGCTSNPSSISVIVNPIPSTPTVSNNGALCAGQTLSLSASLVPNATYTWSGPNNFVSAIQNPSVANVSITDAGIYSVFVTVNGCNSVAGNTTVVISASAPSPVASSNSPVCLGQSLNLFATNVSGANYSWTGPNGFTSSLQNPIIPNVTNLSSGTYSVTATTSTCGTSPSANVTVNVISLPITPIASNNGPSCEGSSCTLNISSINGASYAWSGPNGYSSTIQNPTITNLTKSMAGNYAVVISTTQCGVINSYSTDVIVKQKPIINSITSNNIICAGDTFQAIISSSNTSNGATYNWTGVNNFSAFGKTILLNNVNSSNEGQYTVTATDSGCTSLPFNLNLTVKAKPSSPTISNVPPICEGAKLDLSASLISGATYVWSGPNSFSSSVRNPSITSTTKAAEGTYRVYSIVNGCKSAEESTGVIINNKPSTPVITNVANACVGENVNLNTTFVPNASYSWTGPNSFSANTQNINLTSVTVNNSGTYSCLVTVANCSSDLGTSNLSVNSLPAAPILSSFPVNKLCAGDSLQLFASFIDLATYSWTGPAGFIANTRTPVIKNTNLAYSGVYNAVAIKNNCQSLPSTITITVNPTPNTGNISGLTNVSKFDTTSYSVNGLQGSSYEWTVSNNANVLLGAGTNKIQVKWLNVGVGNLKVVETSNQGCVGTEKTFNATITPGVGISESNLSNDLLIYPNPTNDFINISLPNHNIKQVVIYNLMGGEILQTNKTNINISELAYGIYFVKVIDNNGNSCIKKIVKD